VIVPPEVREEIAAHARDELPNESCGILFFDVFGVAVSYGRARNAAASPYRFEIDLSPWWTNVALVHSHVDAPARPSRADVDNVGMWEGRPYFIYSVACDELAGWTIADGRVEALA
jgi:proteasome lid subunit RPN8/RPN11